MKTSLFRVGQVREHVTHMYYLGYKTNTCKKNVQWCFLLNKNKSKHLLEIVVKPSSKHVWNDTREYALWYKHSLEIHPPMHPNFHLMGPFFVMYFHSPFPFSYNLLLLSIFTSSTHHSLLTFTIEVLFYL